MFLLGRGVAGAGVVCFALGVWLAAGFLGGRICGVLSFSSVTAGAEFCSRGFGRGCSFKSALSR